LNIGLFESALPVLGTDAKPEYYRVNEKVCGIFRKFMAEL